MPPPLDQLHQLWTSTSPPMLRLRRQSRRSTNAWHWRTPMSLGSSGTSISLGTCRISTSSDTRPVA